MNPSHLAKGVGPDLYWASSFELHHLNEGQPDRGGRAIDDVYMYEIVIKYFYPLSNTSTFPRTACAVMSVLLEGAGSKNSN